MFKSGRIEFDWFPSKSSLSISACKITVRLLLFAKSHKSAGKHGTPMWLA